MINVPERQKNKKTISSVAHTVYVAAALTVANLLAPANAVSADHAIVSAMGTSLTRDGGWLDALGRELGECLGKQVYTLNHGISGGTSKDGIEILADVTAAQPDIILIEYAMNDASVHRFISLEESVRNMTTIIDEVRKVLPRTRIFVQATNPAHGLKGWARPFLDSYYDAHLDLGTNLNIGTIDHRPIWRNLSSEYIEMAIPDGVHPLPEYSINMTLQTITSSICQVL